MTKTKQEVELEAGHARDLLNSSGWKVLLEPWLNDRIEALKDQLLENVDPAQADRIRGEALAYKKVIREVHYRAGKSGSDVFEPETD